MRYSSLSSVPATVFVAAAVPICAHPCNATGMLVVNPGSPVALPPHTHPLRRPNPAFPDPTGGGVAGGLSVPDTRCSMATSAGFCLTPHRSMDA